MLVTLSWMGTKVCCCCFCFDRNVPVDPFMSNTQVKQICNHLCRSETHVHVLHFVMVML